MTINATAYKQAAYPPTPWAHLSDEDIAAALDKSDRHRKAARKAHETRKGKAEQQARKEVTVS